MENNIIQDAGDLRKYRTELPNLIDDMNLSVYAYRLYGHFKRVCGANGGMCRQGTRTISQHCGMSMGAVSKAKEELHKAGLISIVSHDRSTRLSDEITMVDVWPENFQVYSSKGKGTLQQRVSAATCSLREQGIRSQGEHKKEPVSLENCAVVENASADEAYKSW